MAFRLPPKSTLTAFISHRFLRFLSSPSLNLPKLEPSNEADSLSQILLTHHNPFHSMEYSLQIHGVSLSPFMLHQTVIRLQHSSKIALSFFLFSKYLPPPPLPSSPPPHTTSSSTSWGKSASSTSFGSSSSRWTSPTFPPIPPLS
ncbi:hypothetical protein HRI_001316100 [Hibiscus trionum]|uniref:Uncharacterized protein n=1 Tax=Hibiscus trionum TaxID=183268 RepID=A0A9W7HFP5_HIBTR|nr:hypothetical protein HRI_001316100 [Hibiscus trionum]